jgi:ferrous iron transport protein B
VEGFNGLRLQIVETMRRFELFTPVLQKAVQKKAEKTTLSDRLDGVLTHKIWAPVIFFGIMFLVFQAVFAWASYPMDWIEMGFGAAAETLRSILPAGWFTDLLTEGVISGLGGIVVFVPQIAILFLLVTLLEEVGYMSRAVFIFDKLMQQFGLNGRSVVALVSGGACAIPAIMSTRTIGNWRERLITILVTPLISCSARIPVYTVLIGFVVPEGRLIGVFNLQGLAFMGLYLMGIAAALGSAWVFKKILKSSEPSWLMMQLPPYRLPVWRNVGITIWEKTSAFVLEAGKVILVASIILWALASYGPSAKMEAAKVEATQIAQQKNLDETATNNLVASYEIEASFAGHLGKFIEPVIQPLGFDWKIGIALITSFAAREVFVATMATIYSIGSTDDEATIHDRLALAQNPVTGAKVYTAATAGSLLVFYVFALQCMSTLAVVRRETGGWKWPLIQFSFMGVLAYLGSWIAFQALS